MAKKVMPCDKSRPCNISWTITLGQVVYLAPGRYVSWGVKYTIIIAHVKSNNGHCQSNAPESCALYTILNVVLLCCWYGAYFVLLQFVFLNVFSFLCCKLGDVVDLWNTKNLKKIHSMNHNTYNSFIVLLSSFTQSHFLVWT